MSSHDIQQMTTLQDISEVRSVFQSYIAWLFETFPDETDDLGSYYSPDRVQQALDEIKDAFVPPHGLALIGRRDGAPAGCIFAHPIERGIADVKRLFVLPSARGQGLGQALLLQSMAQMQAWGHSTIRLDTALFLTDAIALYRKAGFVEIAPYTAIPEGAVKTALFMEWRPPARKAN